jgi:GT2 family glycosyltransferase
MTGPADTQAPLRVSVIVPTRNGAARLPLLLEALDRQTVPDGTFELVVVDDGSTDGTVEVVGTRSYARAIRNSRTPGSPGATNSGILAARAATLAFTDDDTIPAPDWIATGIQAVAETPSAAIGGHIDVPLPPEPSPSELMDLGRGYLNQRHYVDSGFAATANLWLRRTLIDRVGLFDERFKAQAHDTDFGARLEASGAALRYERSLVVEHPPRSRARQLARKEYRLAIGDVELRAFSVGARKRQELRWTRAGYYRPWGRVWGAQLIEDHGYRLGFRRRATLIAVQYACLQLPAIAGSMVGTVRYRRRLVGRIGR